MSPAELNPFQLIQRVAAFLEGHAIAYRVVGSLASMAYREPRFTNDIDLLADVRLEHCGLFLAAFPPPDSSLSDAAMRNAIEHPGQLNIIHLPSGIKVDMIVLKHSPSGRHSTAISACDLPGSESRVLAASTARRAVERAG